MRNRGDAYPLAIALEWEKYYICTISYHQQVLSCYSASTVSHVERAEDTRIPPWQTKGGGEMLENNPPKTYY